MTEEPLTHLDARGQARMVGVGHKPPVARRAVAEAVVRMAPESARAISDGALPKGDAAAVARVAGIMAAKRTPELIALCHPLPIDRAGVEVEVDAAAGEVRITATVETTARTGVEMEALTAASVAALNVYDLVKGIDPAITIDGLRLVEKTKADPRVTLRVAIVTVSDRSARGEREDRSGPGLALAVEESGAEVVQREVVPDDRHRLATLLQTICDAPGAPDLLLTTGGTGLGPRDCTPEATRATCDRMVPGIAEAIRARSLAVTPHAMLSRAEAGVRRSTLIVNLPGSPGGARDGWAVVADVAVHASSQLRGGDHPGAGPPPAGVGGPTAAE